MIMKKICLLPLFLAVIVGCSSDSNNGGGMDIDAPGKFKATFEKRSEYVTEQQEYAYLGKEDYCYWELGDEVSIFTQTNKNCKYRSLKGDVLMTELGMTEDDVIPSREFAIEDYFAIFPFNVNNAVDADGKLYCSLPAEQIYDPAKVDMNNAIMVSRIPSTSDVFEFKNSCALIKFYIKKYSAAVKDVKVESIEVLSNSNYLAGDMYIETANADYTAKVASTGTSNKAVILTNCEAAGSLSHDEYTVFFVTIPAGTYAKNDLTVNIKTNVSELNYIATLKKEYILARSKYVELKTILGGASIDITDDVEIVDKGIMCDVPKILSQGFQNANINYEYEIPVGDFTINGNGKTFNLVTTAEDVYIFTTFTTHNSGSGVASGSEPSTVTVNDLNITGEFNAVCMGVYEKPATKAQGKFKTVWNNVKVMDPKIIPYTDSEIKRLGSAVCVYGEAVLNGCIVKGTKLTDSEFVQNNPSWTEIEYYDMACTNSSETYINGGIIGKIHVWEQAKIYLDGGVSVDYINSISVSASNLGLLYINDATVREIYINPSGTYDASLQITAAAKIDKLCFGDEVKQNSAGEITSPLFDASYWKAVKIADGATIDKVVVGEEEMSLVEFKEKYSIASL